MATRGLTHRDHVRTYFLVGDALADLRHAVYAGDKDAAFARLEQAWRALDAAAPQVTAKDAATELKVSEPTIRHWANKGLFEVTQQSPLRLSAHSVSQLEAQLKVLRTAGLDKRQWAVLLQTARDRKELELPGARDGLEEALAASKGRRRSADRVAA